MKLSTYVRNNIEKFDCPEWFYTGICDDIELKPKSFKVVS